MARYFDLVIFDVGWTLLNFEGSWSEISAGSGQELVEVLREKNYSLDGSFLSDYRERLGFYYKKSLDNLVEYPHEYILQTVLYDYGYSQVPQTHLREALDAWFRVGQAHWHREDDAFPALQELLKEGYRLGMISNAGDGPDVQTLVDNAELRPYFEQLIISAEVGIRKPSARIFQMALDFFQVTAQRAIMVGDTLAADILGARNAGLASIWITRRADTPENRFYQDSIIPDACAAALSEIPGLLQNWEDPAYRQVKRLG